jgi:hypothetical protein
LSWWALSARGRWSSRLSATPACSELHSDYSLYFDLEHADGTFTYGYTLPFRAAPEWQRVTGVLVPPKPVHILHVFCIFRFHRGVAHFDDVYVRPLVAQVRAAGSSCQYGVPYRKHTSYALATLRQSLCGGVLCARSLLERSLPWDVLRVLRTAR